MENKSEVRVIISSDVSPTIYIPSPIKVDEREICIKSNLIDEGVIYVEKWRDLEVWVWREEKTIKMAFLEEVT